VVIENEYIMRCSSAEWIARHGCWRWLPWDDAIVVLADKLRKMWDSLSELRSSLCERRLERKVLRPALLPVKIAQFTQFFLQVWRHTVKSLSLTERPATAGGKHADPCHHHESGCCKTQFFKQILIAYFC